MTDESETNSTTEMVDPGVVMAAALAEADELAVENADDRTVLNVQDDREMFDAVAERIGVGQLDYMYRNGGALVLATERGIEPVKPDRLAAHVNRRVSFSRMVGDEVRFFLLKTDIARQLSNAVEMCRNVRELRGVVTVPTMRDDGSIICEPGYDEATRYAYIPNGIEDDVDVPEWPSDEQVAAARELVMRPFLEFPFEHGDDGMANTIGFMVTPALQLIAPGHRKLVLIEANQQASGKSHIANGARTVYGGTMYTMPKGDAEMRKSLTAILSSPGAVVYFDNARGKLSFPSLEALLTSDHWSDRVLGTSRRVELVNDRTWAITSNNAEQNRDLARRSLRIRIKTGADPASRRFTIRDLDAWFTAHRAAYLGAVLTLVRAWIIAGSPTPDDGESDSFSRWRRTVRGILAVAGVPGEFDAVSTRVLETEEDEEWHAFLAEMRDVFEDEYFLVKEVAAAIESGKIDPELLPGALVSRWPGYRSPSFTRSLGLGLGYKNGTWFGDIAVEYTGQKRKNAKLWRVIRRE